MEKLELAKACAQRMLDNDQASRDLGMKVEIVEPGVAIARMTVRQNMLNGHDVCHGGTPFQRSGNKAAGKNGSRSSIFRYS